MAFNQSEYYKNWRKANKEKMAAYMREYREKNPDYVEQNNKVNRERRRNKEGAKQNE